MTKWFFAYWFQGNGAGGNGSYPGYGGGIATGFLSDVAGFGDGRAPDTRNNPGDGKGEGPGGIARVYARFGRVIPLEDE